MEGGLWGDKKIERRGKRRTPKEMRL